MIGTDWVIVPLLLLLELTCGRLKCLGINTICCVSWSLKLSERISTLMYPFLLSSSLFFFDRPFTHYVFWNPQKSDISSSLLEIESPNTDALMIKDGDRSGIITYGLEAVLWGVVSWKILLLGAILPLKVSYVSRDNQGWSCHGLYFYDPMLSMGTN